MFARSTATVALIAVAMGICLAIGCIVDQPGAPKKNPTKAQPGPKIESVGEFTAAYTGFVERHNSGNCSQPTDSDSSYTWYSPCFHHLYGRHWHGSQCATTAYILDFDTSALPNASVITDAKVHIFLGETKDQAASSQPAAQGCTPPGGDDGPDLYVGCFWDSITTAGGDLTTTESVPPYMANGSHLSGEGGQGIGGVGEIDVQVPYPNTMVSRNKVSRYVLDREYEAGHDLVTWSVDADGTNAPKLRVAYTVPFSACLDGELTAESGCSSCGSVAVSGSLSATSATITKDDPFDGTLCGYMQQMVMVFDTAELIDAHTMTSAQLSIYVESNAGVNISTKKIGVYSRTTSTACGSITLGQNDFKNCGTLTSLGTITVTSNGTQTFTIPSPESNINESGRTVIVLIDDTTLTDDTGSSHYFTISTNDHGTSGQRPKLEVHYD